MGLSIFIWCVVKVDWGGVILAKFLELLDPVRDAHTKILGAST